MLRQWPWTSQRLSSSWRSRMCSGAFDRGRACRRAGCADGPRGRSGAAPRTICKLQILHCRGCRKAGDAVAPCTLLRAPMSFCERVRPHVSCEYGAAEGQIARPSADGNWPGQNALVLAFERVDRGAGHIEMTRARVAAMLAQMTERYRLSMCYASHALRA